MNYQDEVIIIAFILL